MKWNENVWEGNDWDICVKLNTIACYYELKLLEKCNYVYHVWLGLMIE